MVFVLGVAQSLAVMAIRIPNQQFNALIALGVLAGLVGAANVQVLLRKPSVTIHIAAAGWVFDDSSADLDPLGKQIITCCFDKGTAKDYENLLYDVFK